jgi:hypothetical protein
MQSDYKEIAKITSQRTAGNEQLYKDICSTVFTSLNKNFRKPPSLILKLKGIGMWYLRRQRMRIILEHFPPDFEKTEEDFESKFGAIEHNNRIELFTIFKERLLDYDKYVEERDAVRKIRHATQQLLTPPPEEE